VHPRNLHTFPTRRSSDLERRMINRTMSSQHWLNPSLLQTVFLTHDPTIFLTARMMQFRVFLPFDNPAANKGNNYRRLLTDLAERSEEHTSELQSRENLVC